MRPMLTITWKQKRRVVDITIHRATVKMRQAGLSEREIERRIPAIRNESAKRIRYVLAIMVNVPWSESLPNSIKTLIHKCKQLFKY